MKKFLFLLLIVWSNGVFSQTNDDPCDAEVLNVGNACTSVSGTNVGATDSPGVPSPSCGAYSGEDVWYVVTIPPTGTMQIELSNGGAGTLTNPRYAVYSGDCNNLVLEDCVNTNLIGANVPYPFGIHSGTPGEQLWIRVFAMGANETGTFGLCAYELPTCANMGPNAGTNDFCSSAQVIIPGSSFSASTTGQSSDIPGNLGIVTAGISLENNVWYVFTATSTTHNFDFSSVTNCSAGLQAMIMQPSYDANGCCSGFTQFSLMWDPNTGNGDPMTGVVTNLVPFVVGEQYILMVDGDANAQCDFTINGWVIPPDFSISVANESITEECNPEQLVTIIVGQSFTTDETINLNYIGTGQDGVDFTGSIPSILLPAGTNTLTFNLSAVADGILEGAENVTIEASLSAGGVDYFENATFEIYDPPAIDVVSVDETCGQSNGYIDVNFLSVAEPATITWSPNADGQTGDSIINLSAGDYSGLLTDANGCTLDINETIQNVGDLSFTSLVQNPLCAGACDGSIEITPNTFTGNVNFVWLDENQTAIGDNTGTLTNLCSGEYTVTITDDFCSVQDTFFLTDPAGFNLVASNDTIICINGLASVEATATNGAEPYVYTWGALIGQSQQFSIEEDTLVSVFATDANGCQSETKQVAITLLDSIQLTFNENFEVCQNDVVQFNISASGGNGDYSFSWSPTLNNTSNPSVSVSESAVYTVQVSDGCETPSVDGLINVVVNLPEVPVLDLSESEGCEVLEVELNNSNQNAVANCIWDFGNGEVSSECGPHNVSYDAGLYSVTITTESQIGCDTTVVFENAILVHENPIADFMVNPNPVNASGPEVSLINLSSNNEANQWILDGEQISNQSEIEIDFPLFESGTHSICLFVQNVFGCPDLLCKEIEILEDVTVFAPNSFTPNGDEFNNTWQVYTTGIAEQLFELQIFNRWGEVVWVTNTPETAWDGTYNGNLVPDGVYVWKLVVSTKNGDDRVEYKGTITVLR